MRGIEFANSEYYHIYNRGVDKRDIFSESEDMVRFFQSMDDFNVIDPIGSIYENLLRKKKQQKLGNLVSKSKKQKLVDFICYCLNPNHYHFILAQLVDNGIPKFMHRLGLGFTNYFNQKYDRTGSLFQGTFKAVYINSNEYLLHLSVYVNLNYRLHKLNQKDKVLFQSSWKEYLQDINMKEKHFCNKKIVLDQFRSISEYKKFAEESFRVSIERKEFGALLLESKDLET